MAGWIGSEKSIYKFATEVASEKVRLCLCLKLDGAVQDPPVFTVHSGHHGVLVTVERAGDELFEVVLGVEKAEVGEEEGEIGLRADPASGIPDCTIVLRWTDCVIGDALLLRDPVAAGALKNDPIVARRWAQTKAALLWHSYKRFSEVVGLKRFTSGLGGSDVLVFRPRLRNPDTTRPDFVGTAPLDAVCQAWGANLLIKTGKHDKALEEWERYQVFLADRAHPFMSRSEAFLTAQSPDSTPDAPAYATILGTFLGGDLLQAQPFQSVLRDAPSSEQVDRNLDKVFAITHTWYTGCAPEALGNWWKMFRGATPASDLKLFGRFDLADPKQRTDFTRQMMWDIAFIKTEHLVDHLLGKKRDGLLYRLMEQVTVRYSLIHGDLQPRNILADPNDVWLIDFGETGIGPTLFDFTKLEVYVRLWCLDLASKENTEEEAMQMETLLLDTFTATEASLEPIRNLAPRLGVEADDLVNVMRCISSIRQHAVPYFCQDTPDRREYLAVLYLTVLNTLQYAGTPTAPIANFRWLMALYWVLEDTLSRMMGMEPFQRKRSAVHHARLLTPQWLAGRGIPRRVLYWLETEDGQKALEPLAETRGVLQGASHHLDVFDHTLLVIAYLEEILEDPIEGLLHPDQLDAKVAQNLREQGISLPPVDDFAGKVRPVDTAWLAPLLPLLKEKLAGYLNDERRLLVKWVALFHDVGKPATRVMTQEDKTRAFKTQFFGHEVYGAQLVASRLHALFPGVHGNRSDAGLTALEMIRQHHKHHTQVNRYFENPRLWEALKKCVGQNPVVSLAATEQTYLFPLLDPQDSHRVPEYTLLILHGYADMMACRGPAAPIPLGNVGEIDLALLAFYFLCYPALTHRQTMEKTFDTFASGLSAELGIDGPRFGKAIAHAKEQYLAATCPPDGATASDPPSRETVRAWVRSALGVETAT